MDFFLVLVIPSYI